MSKLSFTAIALVACAIVLALLFSGQQHAPATASLTLSPNGRPLVPAPASKPALEVGEKTKLFMNNNAYLFGAPFETESFEDTDERIYHVGFGREVERASGAKLMGEVSFMTGEKNISTNVDEAAQARLSTAYLKPLKQGSDFRAGLSTDLAPDMSWSTLELQLSMELEDGLNLMLNHDYGKSLKGSEHEYQTGLKVEKKF